MTVTASMVKSLRDRTGAGMMDCKNALVESEGDEEKAVELIQKKGLAKAAKKAGAIAAEGVIKAYIHAGSKLGVLVEVNSQTDFVARNDEFQKFADDVAMQIASMHPLYVRRSEIPDADKERQLGIFRGQIEEMEAQAGKKRPPQAVEKILEGKIGKWMNEVCLEEQPCVLDEEGRTIGQIQEALAARIGEKISVRRFVRFELGEGIEKVQKDLAAEVAETLGG